MEFEVASVKRNKSDDPNRTYASYDLGNEDGPGLPKGAVFSLRKFPIFACIEFAYKLSSYQMRLLFPRLPQWTIGDNYDIEARAEGSPTKDQVRLMMRALLVERFKVAAHWETRDIPVSALVLAKTGRTGPRLKPYGNGPPCTDQASSSVEKPPDPKTACGGPWGEEVSKNHYRLEWRKVSLKEFAENWRLSSRMTNLKPSKIVDQTGLEGEFNFSIEFDFTAPQDSQPGMQPETSSQTELSDSTFLESMKQQLGLKFVTQKGPALVLVIDHVERPSEN
jgi:uncharacterized protein (TIGR03435 family)